MSSLEITEVDPFDPTDFDPWHTAYAEASRSGRDRHAVAIWMLEEMRHQMQDRHERGWRTAWAGRVGKQVVTTGFLGGSNLHNLEGAEIEVCTVPAARGRGFGSAMLEHLESLARERGRVRLTAEVAWAYDGDPVGSGVPDVEFAGRRGYRVGLVDVQRQLEMPVEPGLLDLLAAEAAPYHADYRLQSFVGHVPDDLVEGWVELNGSLTTEAPLGELEREPETEDVAALRSREELLDRQGRRKLNTAAIAPDGEVVAYTDLATTVHEPDRAYQWGTLVRREHRGHRLGMAVKVANLRQLEAEAPQVRRVTTYNAEVNDHMVGINERLGFRPVERLGELQKKLA